MVVVRKQSSPFRVILTLSIFCALFSAQTAWPFNGTVSSTSTAPGSQVSVAVSTTDNSQTITITVTNAPTTPSPAATGMNHPPVLAAIGNKSVQVGSTLSFTISATDADGDPLTYSATGSPIGAAFDGSARTFTWTPTAAQVGPHNIVFDVNDGRGGTASEAITMMVTNAPTTPSPAPATPSPAPTTPSPVPNNPPVLAAIGSKNLMAGQPLNFTISATDPDNDPLTYSAKGLPPGAYFDAAGSFLWNSPTALMASVVAYQTTFSVSDGKGGTDSETIGITVHKKPNLYPPTLAPIGNKTVQAGTNLVFYISAVDPEGDILRYSATGVPTGATFNSGNGVVDPIAGVVVYIPPPSFSWIPTSSQVGDHTVTFTADDGNFSASETITITVNPPP